MRDDMSAPSSAVFELSPFQKRDWPEPFSDIDADRIRPADGNIMTAGCIDHCIYMKFSGLGEFEITVDRKAISLFWGGATTRSWR